MTESRFTSWLRNLTGAGHQHVPHIMRANTITCFPSWLLTQLELHKHNSNRGTWIGISLWHAHCLHSACWCITLILDRVGGEKHSYIFLPSPRPRYKAEPLTWRKRWRMSPSNIAWQNPLSPMLIWPRSRSKQLDQIFGDFPSLEKETAPYHICFVVRVSLSVRKRAHVHL